MPSTAAPPRPGDAPTGVTTDPGDRGRLVVADRVVVRVAAAAAAAVPGSVRTQDARADRTGADRSVGTRVGTAVGTAVDSVLNRSYPVAECTRAGNRVRVGVQVAAQWPTPAADLAARVRAEVVDQLSRLAGVVVDSCDVTVADYVRSRPQDRRVL
ncbi:hypothetical protein [Kineococcus sp. SYSU DK002]|uniref:hypothetical protein n=1 Tax=Kineococcus sp. SYSU DK002 TaxID=3383123 RepID=UPI003D7E6FB4